MSDPRLKSFFDRLQRLMGERDNLSEDIAEVRREAAGAGYDPAVLMRVIAEDRRRAKNPEAYAEREELTDLYTHAIRGEGAIGRSSRIERAKVLFGQGKSVREVAKLMSISKSEAGRLRQLVGECPEPSLSQIGDSGTGEIVDPETGEIPTEEPPAPEAAPVVGKDWPDMPPFLARGAVQ